MATNTIPTKQDHTAANNSSGNTSGPYAISFDYLSESDVEVRIANTLKTQTTHYTFPTKSTIQFTSGNFPALGATIEIKRNTDITVPKVDFEDGSVLTETDLDNNSKHLLFGMQETKEDTESLVSTFVGATAPTGISNGARWYDTVSGRTFVYYVDTDTAQWVEANPPFDAAEFASNVQNSNIAANAAIDASKLAFTQTGTGATARTVDNKFKDIVSVKDFGAVGDGTTDDTTAINNAIASLTYLAGTQTANGSTGGEVYFPAGRYKITDTIILTGKNGLHLHGEGVEATEIFMSSSDSNGKAIFKNADTFASNLVDCHITHMTLYGDGNTKANAHGVEFLNTNGCYLQNLSIYACKYGLYLRESWQLTLETIDAHGGTDQRCDIGVHLGEKPTNEGDVNNAVTANGVTVKDCITAGFRIVQGQGSKFVNCESGNTPIGFHIGEASSSISGFNAEFKKCQWLTFVNCLADTNTSFGWKIAKGATLTELSEMHFANCWSGYAINDTCISVDGANDLIFSNWLVINCGHGIKVLDSNKLQFSNFRIDQYNRNNNSSQGIKLTDSQHIFFEGILSSDNNFTNGDFIEVNDDGTACNSNTFVTRSSNTGTLVGSASRNFRNEQIQGGTIGLLEIQATGNNQSTVKYNNNANNWDVGITNQTDNYFRWVYSGSQVLFLGSNGTLFPATDNAFDLGAGGNRWDDVFATNGTIQTSDENLKQDIQSLTTAEKAVATALKGLIKTFKYKSAVTAKGDDARIHCGVIAQQVKAAFEAQSLKAEDYALFCFDQWDEKKSSDGSIIRSAGSAYSIRYNELLAFIISAL